LASARLIWSPSISPGQPSRSADAGLARRGPGEGLAGGVNVAPGETASEGLKGFGRAVAVADGGAGQDGRRSRVRLSIRDLRRPVFLAGFDMPNRGETGLGTAPLPHSLGRVLGCPAGQVQVEGAD
jgi:hypothetical protein